MEYLLVLILFALAIVVGSIITHTDHRDNRNIPGKTFLGNNEESTKKCPHCLKDIEAKSIKCRNCGALINFLGIKS